MRHDAVSQAGMPPIERDSPPVSHFEFWPAWAFYAPVWAWIAMLAIRHRGVRLPLLANPGLPAGGLVGEAKSQLFPLLAGPEAALLPSWIAIERWHRPAPAQLPMVERKLMAAGLRFPLVAKPDIGCRGAGVRPLRDRESLVRYLEEFPHGARMILQRMVEDDGEAGVFYVRPPGATRGRIVSLTLKYFPHIVGNGLSTVRELILADPRAGRVPHLYLDRFADRLESVPAPGEAIRLVFSGSHSKGAIFRNGNAWITAAMERRFDAIADAIPGFHFGRFDVRFADFKEFRRGKNFSIIEFNGAGAESTHIWDSRTSLGAAWAALFAQYRALFRIGAANRALGHTPEGWRGFVARWRRERDLTRRYPKTG